MLQYPPCPAVIDKNARFEFWGWVVYLFYRHNHSGERFLASGIDNGELGAEVIEHGAVRVT